MNFIKTLLVVLVLCIASTISAQIQKGNIQIGIGTNSNLLFGDQFSLVDWKYTAEAGLFFKDKWLLGFSGEYISQSGALFSRKEHSKGVFTRYYLPASQRFHFYGDLYVGSGRIVGKSDTEELLNFKLHFLQIGIGLGANYHVTKNIALEAGIRRSINKFFNNGQSNQGDFDIRFGLRVNFKAFK